jgi:predicted nuclease of restriction endonuclease-like (RecB) superfamily
MSKLPSKALRGYADLLREVKLRIREAQTRAVLSANAVMIRLYWDLGRLIDRRQHRMGWGTSVIPRLSRDIRNDLPAVKGFSERNLGRMIAFYREYADSKAFLPTASAKLSDGKEELILPTPLAKLTRGRASQILPPAVAKLPPRDEQLQALVMRLPWAQNVLLIQKVKDLDTRLWYMQETLQNGWSHDILAMMIDSQVHNRQGKAVTNFAAQLPPAQSDLALQALKDPYIFDFLTLEEPFHERELETLLRLL